MSQLKSQNVLFVTRALPYEAAGTPIVIRNLLLHLSKQNYFVLGRRPDPSKRLPKNVKQEMFQIPILYTKGHRFWKYFSILPGFIMGVWIIKRYRITKLVGVFQDDASLILSYWLTSVFKKIEFYPYMMDLYAEQAAPSQKPKTEKFQQRVFDKAKKVLVSNDGMQKLLDKKYPEYIFTSIPIISQSKASKKVVKAIEREVFVIVFSGSVNIDRLETLRVFANIVSKKKNLTLRYLTSQSQTNLQDLGVFFEGFELAYCTTSDELMAELNNADLLYLPLNFKYPDNKKEQMKTCFGAKVYDYMVASTPILIHAPDTFFNYTFFAENRAAFLIDTLQDSEVEQKLTIIQQDAKSDEGAEKVGRANDLAKNFRGEVIANLFKTALKA